MLDNKQRGVDMQNIFEELWYGKISPWTDCRKNTQRIKNLAKELSDCYDRLYSTLNNEQKKMLDEYEKCHLQLVEINEQEVFEYAFSLGVKIMIESFHR